MPAAIRSRFPDEMSIILQHEFWDLVVTQEAFEVSLNFARKPERLTVPFDAITGFTDPSVPFGFKLEPRAADGAPKPRSAPALAPARKPEPARRPFRLRRSLGRLPNVAAEPAAAKPAAPAEKAPEPSGAAKVVSIDAFRKK